MACSLPFLLGAASDANLSYNIEMVRNQSTVLAMVDAAIRNDRDRFAATVSPAASFELWDDKFRHLDKHPLTIGDVRSLSSTCLIREVSACGPATVVVEWACTGGKDRVSTIEMAESKVVDLLGNGPPPLCPALKPVGENG